MGSINECFSPKENVSNTLIIYKSTKYTNKKRNCSAGKNKHFQEKIFMKRCRSSSGKAIRSQNRPKVIDLLSLYELSSEISEIIRVRIPFFNNEPLQSLSAISFITGNGPYHEGFMILTKIKTIYITQVYPITFIKVNSINEGIYEIMSFNTFNKNTNKFFISDIYIPHEAITVMDIYDLIKIYPNKYDIFSQNCQKFCDYIIFSLAKKFKIERDNDPDSNKVRYSKIKRLFKNRFLENNDILININVADNNRTSNGKKYCSNWNGEISKRFTYTKSIRPSNLFENNFM